MKIPSRDDDVWRWIVIGLVLVATTLALYTAILWEVAHRA
jgi:hypothetical protein